MIKFARKFIILFDCLHGYIIKYFIDLGIINIPQLNANNTNNIVVSLTSYGRRVKNSIVYYTIVSLLRQKVQPKRIILWLSETEWNDEILPSKLKLLREKGVDIRYCKDIRSYKKLIPTLNICSSENILTVDDDVIYSSDMIKTIIKENNRYPSNILCFKALNPIIVDGIPQNYGQWKQLYGDISSKIIFPVGVGGVLYPPRSLHLDVVCDNLFEELCPMADDIWFWFNSVKNNTVKRIICKKSKDFSFDALYQYFHKGSALTHINRLDNQNDKQFLELFRYYNLNISEQGDLYLNNSIK